MPDKPWKQHERKAAATFGALRKPGSGSQGRADQTRSDSCHPLIYLECKTRAKCVIRTLVNATRKLAKAEGKTAVVITRETGKPGAIYSAHESDLRALVVQWVVANHSLELWDEIVVAVKNAYGIEPGDCALPPRGGEPTLNRRKNQ
jgi:hypothetical protein